MTETTRLSVYQDIAALLGEEKAAVIMESIPTIPWQEFATKADLAALKDWTETKIEGLTSEMNGHFHLLRGEINKVDGNLSKEIASLANKIAAQTETNAEQFAALNNQMAALAKDTTEQLAEQKRDNAEQFAALNNQMAEQTRDSAKQNRTVVLWMAGFVLTLYATLIGGFIFT